MKKTLVLLALLVMVGNTSAAFLNNGDFESVPGFPGDGWSVWRGGNVTPIEHTSGGVGDSQYVSLDNGDDGWSGWFNQDGEGGNLNELGISAGSTVRVSVDMILLSGAPNVSGLKVDSWLGGVGGTSVDDSGSQVFTITTDWATYSTDYTIHPHATELVVSMMNLAIDFGTPAHVGFDNIQVTPLAPVPEPTTLVLLGMGGLLIRKK